MSRASAGFGADLGSVGEARRFVRRALADMGAEDLEFEACQVVSELATNAVIHAATPFQVDLEHDGATLQIRVSDSSPKSPITKAHSDQATTGRGLRLVAKLADAWGTEVRPNGKTVWCTLRAGAGRTGLPRVVRMGEEATTSKGRASGRGAPGGGLSNLAEARVAA